MNTANLVYLTIAPLISVIGVVLNSATIYIFHTLSLDKMTLYLTCSICISDIASCVFANLVYIANICINQYAWMFGNEFCKMFRFFTMAVCVSQIWCLALLCIDRRRRLIDTSSVAKSKQTVILYLTCVWIFSIAITFPRIYQFGEKKITRKSHTNNSNNNVVEIICKPVHFSYSENFFMSTHLFFIAFLIPAVIVTFVAISTIKFIHNRQKLVFPIIREKFRKMTLQLTVSMIVSTAIFLLIWSPFFILGMLDNWLNLLYDKSLRDLNFTLRCTLLLFGSLKSVVYLVINEKMRSKMKEMLACKLSSRNGDSESSNGFKVSDGLKLVFHRRSGKFLHSKTTDRSNADSGINFSGFDMTEERMRVSNFNVSEVEIEDNRQE